MRPAAPARRALLVNAGVHRPLASCFWPVACGRGCSAVMKRCQAVLSICTCICVCSLPSTRASVRTREDEAKRQSGVQQRRNQALLADCEPQPRSALQPWLGARSWPSTTRPFFVVACVSRASSVGNGDFGGEAVHVDERLFLCLCRGVGGERK